MSEATLQLAAALLAVVSVVWAGLFALAREAKSSGDPLGDPPGDRGGAVPLGQAMQVCHLALLVFSGAAASQAVAWWDYPLPQGVGRILLSLAFLYIIASGIPRAIGPLLPQVSESTAGMARASLTFFKPLIAFLSLVEGRMHAGMPAPERATDRYGPEHHDMLDGVFSLGDTTVEEAMTPRLDVESLSAEAPWREVVDLLRRSDHARLPVYQEDLDTITGVLYAKDLTPSIVGLAQIPDKWQDHIRPASFVPESKTLTAQLRDFQRGPGGLAIVVDEFGGTSGIITLEDVLEEVVGEIHGEYEEDVTPAVEQEGDDRFWVDGSLPLDDLSDLLGVPFEIEDVATVGGLVFSELGHVPSPGEELRVDGFRVVVEQVERRRIKRVYFERQSEESSREELEEGDA